LQRTGTALHLSLVKSLARLHQRSKAAPAAERNVSPSTGLHATYGLHAGVQSSRPPRTSPLAALASPPRLRSALASLAALPRETQHKLPRASASGLLGKGESSSSSTTRAAAPSSQVSGVELYVDALDDMVSNCIFTLPAVDHGADSLCDIDSSWVLDDSRCGIRN